MQKNIIEIKARCHRPDWVKQQLTTWNAKFIGVDHQIDTYFNVPTGRLKLRQGNVENHFNSVSSYQSGGPPNFQSLIYINPPIRNH